MDFNFTTFPVLKTERLTLRQSNENDAEVILELRSSEEINKFVATKRMQNLDEAKEFIKGCLKDFKNKTVISWALEYNQKVIGSIVLHSIVLDKSYGEIGFKLMPEFHQKGFMSEALKEVLNFGFTNLKLKTIEAFTHKNNSASFALLKKHHFVFQPERRDDDYEDYRIFKIEK